VQVQVEWKVEREKGHTYPFPRHEERWRSQGSLVQSSVSQNLCFCGSKSEVKARDAFIRAGETAALLGRASSVRRYSAHAVNHCMDEE